MARPKHTPPLASLEEAATALFRLVDDAYRLLNPRWRSHEPEPRTPQGALGLRGDHPRHLPSSFGAWSRSAPSCARSPAFSATSSRRSSASIPPRSTEGYASSGDFSNP